MSIGLQPRSDLFWRNSQRSVDWVNHPQVTTKHRFPTPESSLRRIVPPLPTGQQTNSKRASLPYMAGLDGLRALAVVAVLLYHGQDVGGIANFLKPQGGFLGVEVFFVISGYLITSLLLQEHSSSERIDLKGFWIRRARRLLPALYVFLVGTATLAGLFATDAFDKLRREVLGALFYVSNWLLIATDESYFDAAGRPSLLRHLWSLAIEEQFYLIWPLIVLGGLRFAGRRVLLGFTLVAVAASTTLLWLLFDRIEQYGDVTSLYYRTDARAAALLSGAALAMVWQPWSASATNPIRSNAGLRWAIDMAGVAGIALVVVMNYGFTDRTIEWAKYTRLYHGGFLALSASTLLVIAAVAVPGSRLGWLLGNPVMRWVGTRSYGLYLWHWPVFQLTRPRLDVDIDGYLLLGVRLGITAVLVELSYQLIELPIRERRFVSSLKAAITTPSGIMVGSGGALALILATAIVAVAIPTIDRGGAVQVATSEQIVQANEAQQRIGGSTPSGDAPSQALDQPAIAPTPTPGLTPTPGPSPTATTSTSLPAVMVDGDFDTAEPTPEPTPTQPPLPPPPPLSAPFDMTSSQIHIVGDSVIAGAQSQLYRISPTVTIDGRIGRQWWELEGELRAMRAQGLANDVVIIHLGNNGNFNQQMFDGVMSALQGTRLVLFVNVHAPVVWESEVNSMLISNVNRYAENARLIDWYSASTPHPEYFIEDGTHLQGPGMVALRLLIENALLSLS